MSEVFKFDSETASIRPGDGWAEAIKYARFMDGANPGYERIKMLGTALAGAATIVGSHDVKMDEFAQAAVPPFTYSESSHFEHGFNVGEHVLRVMSVEGAHNV